jgi:nucleoside-diphosphate-sugar epimerase
VKIAITGATGFLGTQVVAELLARNHHLRCAVRSADKGASLVERLSPIVRRRIEVVAGKLERPEFSVELIENCDAVVHVAAPLTGSPSALFTGGVIPTRVLVNAATTAGVRRFVLVSSLGVYGTQHLAADAILDEGCPIDRYPHRRDAYTYSKVVQEQVCWEAHNERGLPLVVIRPGVLFGPGRRLLTARVGLMLGHVLIQMGGRQQVPYCFVDNCAQAIANAAEVPGVEGMSFNVVDDHLPSSNQIWRLHRTFVAPTRRLKMPAWAIRPLAHVCEWASLRSDGMFPAVLTPYKASALWRRLQFSNALAKTRLGWRPTVTFEDAVERTLRALDAAPHRREH